MTLPNPHTDYDAYKQWFKDNNLYNRLNDVSKLRLQSLLEEIDAEINPTHKTIEDDWDVLEFEDDGRHP